MAIDEARVTTELTNIVLAQEDSIARVTTEFVNVVITEVPTPGWFWGEGPGWG